MQQEDDWRFEETTNQFWSVHSFCFFQFVRIVVMTLSFSLCFVLFCCCCWFVFLIESIHNSNFHFHLWIRNKQWNHPITSFSFFFFVECYWKTNWKKWLNCVLDISFHTSIVGQRYCHSWLDLFIGFDFHISPSLYFFENESKKYWVSHFDVRLWHWWYILSICLLLCHEWLLLLMKFVIELEMHQQM